MKHKLLWGLLAVVATVLVWKSCAGDAETTNAGTRLRLATTTSVVDSGLLDVLLPAFEKESGYRVEVASVGSGRALEQLAAGQADVVISHAPPAERAAIFAGDAGRRTPFMHNDFVVVGPKKGVAAIAGSGNIRDALLGVAASGRSFYSRGDRSGTHQREQALWRLVGIGPDATFVVSTRAGMKTTLEQADKKDGFALTDRATYLALRKSLDLVVIFQGDDELRNDYSVVEPAAKSDGARVLAQFVLSDNGRRLIGAFGISRFDEPLFVPAEQVE